MSSELEPLMSSGMVSSRALLALPLKMNGFSSVLKRNSSPINLSLSLNLQKYAKSAS